MKGFRYAAVAAAAALLAVIVAPPLMAHEVTYQGTVLQVESGKIQVKAVDLKTKKEEDVWFNLDRTTKVKRGDKAVALAAAAITKGERIVVIVDHDAETKMLAKEVRLAAK
jgi:hypothetical protein